jgi:hypothetical protein
MLERKKCVPFNHNYPGLSSNGEIVQLPGNFQSRREIALVGKGLADFKKATELMTNFEMINRLPWGEMRLYPPLKQGSVVCTLIKCYGLLWSLNPCRVVSIRDLQSAAVRKAEGDASKWGNATPPKAFTQIVYSTVEGKIAEFTAECIRVVDTK